MDRSRIQQLNTILPYVYRNLEYLVILWMNVYAHNHHPDLQQWAV